VGLLTRHGEYKANGLFPELKHSKDKNRSRSILGGCRTPKATLVERSQVEIEQFLAMLRFENRSKFEELPGILK